MEERGYYLGCEWIHHLIEGKSSLLLRILWAKADESEQSLAHLCDLLLYRHHSTCVDADACLFIEFARVESEIEIECFLSKRTKHFL